MRSDHPFVPLFIRAPPSRASVREKQQATVTGNKALPSDTEMNQQAQKAAEDFQDEA